MSLIKVIRYDENNPFDGVFNFITKYTKEDDIHTSNHVHIYVSSNGTGGSNKRDVRTPIGYENNDRNYYWISQNKENSWYAVDFRGFKLKLDSYVYKACETDFLEKWEVLGSNDNISWTSLCMHKNPFKNAQETLRILHETCNNNQSMLFSLFKLITYGIRALDQKNYFALYGLEFFGELYTKYNVYKSCSKLTLITKDFIFCNIYLFTILS